MHVAHSILTVYQSNIVDSFATLLRPLSQSEDYKRARTAAGITAFVLEQSRPAVVPLASVADAQVQYTVYSIVHLERVHSSDGFKEAINGRQTQHLRICIHVIT